MQLLILMDVYYHFTRLSEKNKYLSDCLSGIKCTITTVLLDSSRNTFTACADKTTVVPGGMLAVTYSGAGTGEYEVVSAMLCDSEGTPLYYANLTFPAAAHGT